MKWKITGRFLAAILITVIVVTYCLGAFNLFSSYLYFSKDKNRIIKYYDKSVSSSAFFNAFKQNIGMKGGKINIEKTFLDNLKANKIWIQVLDENGTEIYNRFKPVNFPKHYIPAELVQYSSQSGTIKGSTLYTGIIEKDLRKLTYIMGFPSLKTDRVTFYFSHETLLTDIVKILLGITLTIILVSLFSGYFFSRWLANPVVSIIDGIKALSQGDYSRSFKTDGLYKDVYHSLNTLSQTLAASEAERLKTEKTREEWIANITHDLKTPLASIKGYSEILLDQEYNLSNEEKKKYAEIILNKTNYIGDLVEDLKLTYQLKNSLSSLDIKEENLVDIVRDTIIGILNHPKYENADIDLCASDESLMYHCDRTLLQRAFSNIIYNSLVHNDSSTKVKVEVKIEKDIAINFSDNGKGISQEDLSKLFERYYRGTSTGEAHKGSGLGMAIAKQIIEAHGGTISVESSVGTGTTVHIRFETNS